MPTYPDPTTVTAREVLAGLRGIIEREQMGHDGYISREVDRELAEAGALCRGHRACAVGSTWLAAGIVPEDRSARGFRPAFILPGVEGGHDGRVEWLEGRGYHGLLTAYRALCDAAQEYLDEHGFQVSEAWTGAGALEGLFESEHDEYDVGYLIEPRDMLVVIDRAEELLSDVKLIAPTSQHVDDDPERSMQEDRLDV